MARQNVLLLVLDAVRKDHVSAYDYNRQTTPTIDKLSNDGVIFENAFANSNWTGTSHASIFTGLLPSISGTYASGQTLPENVATLPEHLQKAGYSTFGVSAGAHIRQERGYDRGFDKYKETFRISLDRSVLWKAASDPGFRRQIAYSSIKGPDKKSLYKIEALKRWIGGINEPFFGFVNLKTAHNPYNPPRPYKSKYCPNLKRPKFQFVEEIIGDSHGERQSIEGMDFRRLQRLSYEFPYISREISPNEKEWEIIKSWYDGSIRYMDDRISDLVDYLSDINKLDDTYIIITSDHGEYFGEHGLEKHTYSLYEPVLHVPLVVYAPGQSGKRIEAPVSLVDLFPTILDMADVTFERDNAVSLHPFEDKRYHEYLFAELGAVSSNGIKRHHPNFDDTAYGEPMQSVRDHRFKLIAHANGDPELYDWVNDPGEEKNLSNSKPEKVDELVGVMNKELAPLNQDALDEQIDDEVLKGKLQELGYI